MIGIPPFPRIVRPLLFSLGVISLVGCGGVQDPYGASEPGAEGGSLERYRVRFEVLCDTCSIRWEVAGESGTVTEEARWQHRVPVVLHSSESTIARLSAAGRPGRPVSYVRIVVDGEVMAVAGRGEEVSGFPQMPLQVEVRLPPGG